ncbi:MULTISPECIES: WecB/TagA/CpsF family glycosyltransferase [unclassified Gordonia]|uniref:WecB/TagA/CpsF family glycosyltransferase n=1 Tax=unclassified Gordonia (in: high G+C Gram-positive bacteria) TaxID=2657482 RepID=UPI0019623EE5|nr:WecB/TagA/CpsF family glycosyltransferase [Gordonia sp. BP-119]MBN0984476.1 WecB/TagA/CpsF family glycosyltransferase [Gordonia sp. BP-94]
MDAEEVVALVQDSQSTDRPLFIANHNLHSVYVFWTDESFRSAYDRASVVLIDGWPILAWARWFGSTKQLSSRHRIGSTDWVLKVLETSSRRLRVVAVGGSPTSARGAADFVNTKFPQHRWRAFDGYEFKCQDADSSTATLESSIQEADIVLVGMGMPRQEAWIIDNWSQLRGSIVANVGGCFDYFSGEQDLAPRWLGAVGMEWAYRLARSPGRLAHRYLVEPFLLLGLVARREISRRVRRH